MRRIYSWTPIEVVVEAPDGALEYAVTLRFGEFISTPILIEGYWGADDAAMMALGIYHDALTNSKRFLAEQRMESLHMPVGDKDIHVSWAEQIVQESSNLGVVLEEALKSAQRVPPLVDATKKLEQFMDLNIELYQNSMELLRNEGHSQEEAQRIYVEGFTRRMKNKWRLTPRRRIPTAVHR